MCIRDRPYFVLELTDCLEERLALDVADGTADFNDGNVCLLGSKVPVKAALDLVCDVRDLSLIHILRA